MHRPTPLPDFANDPRLKHVIRLLEEELDLNEDNFEPEFDDTYVYEAVASAIYGDDYFSYINWLNYEREDEEEE